MKITNQELDILLDVASDKSRIDSDFSKISLIYFTTDLSFNECYQIYFKNTELTKTQFKNICDFIDEKYLNRTELRIIKSPNEN